MVNVTAGYLGWDKKFRVAIDDPVLNPKQREVLAPFAPYLTVYPTLLDGRIVARAIRVLCGVLAPVRKVQKPDAAVAGKPGGGKRKAA